MSIEAISPFHAQFKPLPSDWPIDLYRKADRLVIALDDSVAESDIDAIAATLDFATSSTEHGLNSDNCTILLLCSDEQVLASSTRLKDKLASEGNWTLHAVVINQPSDYRALLSAATLCLYRSAIDCADSVSVGTPCLAWDSHDPGQPIRTRADIKFIGAPKHALDRLHTQGELQQLLQCWLELTCTDCADPSAPIINPAMDSEKQAVLADRMSTSLNQSHRKFRKFRESPSRFVNDSQSPLLRPFKNKRLSS